MVSFFLFFAYFCFFFRHKIAPLLESVALVVPTSVAERTQTSLLGVDLTAKDTMWSNYEEVKSATMKIARLPDVFSSWRTTRQWFSVVAPVEHLVNEANKARSGAVDP